MDDLPRERLGRCLSWLQGAVALFALAMLFRGQGRSTNWVVLFFVLPALRLGLSPRYRARERTWLAEARQQAEEYPHGKTPWQALLLLTVASLALLALFDGSVNSGDSEPVLLMAVSLLRQGDWELSEYGGRYAGSAYHRDGELPYFLCRTRTGVHSAYPLGMTTFAVPAALLCRAAGGDLDETETRRRVEKWTACWVAAACLCLFFLLGLYHVRPAPALVLTALLATGSALYSTVGQALWQHGGVIFFSLLALLLEHRQARRESVSLTLLQGAACALMVACRLSSALFVLALGFWVLARSPRRAILLTVATAAAFAPWAWLHGSIYGTPLGLSSGLLTAPCWTGALSDSLAGVLFSPSRGLIVYQPWLLLGLAVLVPAVRRRLPAAGRVPCPAGWGLFCVSAIVLHLALVGSWRCWWGGYCWGSRLASEVVPLAALLLLRPLAALWSSRGGRGLILAAGVLSLLLHVGALQMGSVRWNMVVDSSEAGAHHWSWRHPPFLYPFQKEVPCPDRTASLPRVVLDRHSAYPTSK